MRKPSGLYVAECYSMDLYCKWSIDFDHDHRSHGVSVSGYDRAAARKEAKALGWKLHKDGTATCPECVKNN